MRIGIISTYSNPCPPLAYGGESYYFGLADTLGWYGHEVHLFAPAGSQAPHNGVLHYIPHTEKGQINYGIEVGVEKDYHDLLLEMDVVHDCSLDHITAERLRHLYGKREIINTINGRTYYMPRPPFNVVTGSKAWQADALQYGLQTEMVYWGVDTSFYTPGDDNRREDWYLWLARFHPDKGLDLALDLAEILGFKLKVAGSMQFSDHAEYGKKYLERIAGLPNVEYVELPMDSTHHIVKRELYRKAHAFLYPVQYFECFGMVVVEAMACGCPVITTPNGAMPELVRHGLDGFICPTKADFRKALDHNTYHRIRGMRSKCIKQAQQFSWKSAAAGYELLYEQVMAGKGW